MFLKDRRLEYYLLGRKKYAFFLKTVLLLSSFTLVTHALAQDIPRPPKRPAIMNASPAYIEELIRQKTPEALNAIPPASAHEEDITPFPGKKPIFEQADQNSAPQHTGKSALMSFVVEPGQKDLGETIKTFLSTRTANMLRTNPNSYLEIQSYASMTQEDVTRPDPHAALERALKARKILLDDDIDSARIRLVPAKYAPKSGAKDRLDVILITPDTDETQSLP